MKLGDRRNHLLVARLAISFFSNGPIVSAFYDSIFPKVRTKPVRLGELTSRLDTKFMEMSAEGRVCFFPFKLKNQRKK